METGLKGKVALVAAASQGLGYGVARALAQDGARVSICSRRPDEIQTAAEKLKSETGAEVIATPCDVTDAASIKNWIDRSVAEWGIIDALLVNAGGPPAGLFVSFTDEQWQAAFNLTLMSTVRMIRGVIPHMTNGGSILTVTSSSVREPITNLVLSTVMRSGVAALVKDLADELAPQKIRLNNLIPGRIDTARVQQLDEVAAKRQNIPVEQVRKSSIERIPLKRLGTIDDFGAAAAFLLSPAASYITGATLQVDGGSMRGI